MTSKKMVDTYLGPSELHLKRDLSQLGRSRLFRDPDTLGSWKSLPVSNSCGATLNLNHENDKLEHIQGNMDANYGNEISENNEDNNDNNMPILPLKLPSGIEKRNKARLRNWEHSSKSSDDGFQLDDDKKQPVVEESQEETKSRNIEIKGRKPTRKARKGISLGKRKKNMAAKKIDLGISDDSGYSESEKSKHNLTLKMDSNSQCTSPIFLNSNKISRIKRRSSSFSSTPTSFRSQDRTSDSLHDSDLGVSRELSKKLKGTVQRKRSKFDQLDLEYLPKASPTVPSLINKPNHFDSFEDSATDDMISNFSELDLESISRLNKVRCSNCSMDGVVFEPYLVKDKSLCQKYRPKSFDEIVSQNIVVQSLNSAIKKDRIAPAYLFQGPRGTGKTSTAYVFAAALNCLSVEDNKPCRSCKECKSFAIQKGRNMKKLDANNKSDVCKMKHLLKKLPANRAFSKYKIFVIDECHGLSFNSWTMLMKFAEQPIPRVVFIFITIEPDNLSYVSHCQKFLFSKIKDADIASKLKFISFKEGLDVEKNALELIATNSKGSLGDAETMLDQLSLLGKRITTSLVNDLFRVAPDEELLKLLEVALSSNTAETVKMSRELMETGVDPVAIMSQLAGLVMDIISGKCSSMKLQFFPVTQAETKTLHRTLKILSDAEKQIRNSGEQTTWFTAALLQLGSIHSAQPTPSCSSIRSNKRLDNMRFWESSSASIPGITSARNSLSTRKDDKMFSRHVIPNKLDDIWRSCIENINSESLRDLLNVHGKLVGVTESKGILTAYIAFEDIDQKYRAEKFLRHIGLSLASVMMHNVEVKIGILSEKFPNARKSTSDTMSTRHAKLFEHLNSEGKSEHLMINTSSDIRLSVDEQRLEGAWLRVGESGEGSLVYQENQRDPSLSLKHWKGDERDEIQEAETSGGQKSSKGETGGKLGAPYPLSPSLLRNISYKARGYDSGPIQSGFCCWGKFKRKAKQTTRLRSLKVGRG